MTSQLTDRSALRGSVERLYYSNRRLVEAWLCLAIIWLRNHRRLFLRVATAHEQLNGLLVPLGTDHRLVPFFKIQADGGTTHGFEVITHQHEDCLKLSFVPLQAVGQLQGGRSVRSRERHACRAWPSLGDPASVVILAAVRQVQGSQRARIREDGGKSPVQRVLYPIIFLRSGRWRHVILAA